jgi:sugar/nucleoside kinase (ribokinase family)
MQTIDCTVIGDAMIDVVLPVIQITNFEQLSSGDVFNCNSSVNAGGLSNVAVFLAQLGCHPAFVGKTGNDFFGSFFFKDLEKYAIDRNIAVSNTQKTGVVYDMILGTGERVFFVDRGANDDLAFSDLNLDLLKRSKYIYMSGFSFQNKKLNGTYMSILKYCKDLEKPIIFNIGSFNLADKHRKIFLEIIEKYASIAVMNENEAKKLTGLNNENAAVNFLKEYIEKIIVTKGKKGSIICSKKLHYMIRPYEVPVVDTTGAGDAFAAAYLCGLLRGLSDESAGNFASKFSSIVVSHKGSRIKTELLIGN